MREQGSNVPSLVRLYRSGWLWPAVQVWSTSVVTLASVANCPIAVVPIRDCARVTQIAMLNVKYQSAAE